MDLRYRVHYVLLLAQGIGQKGGLPLFEGVDRGEELVPGRVCHGAQHTISVSFLFLRCMSDGIGSPAMAIDLAALLQDPEDLRQYCPQLLAE